MGLGRGRQTALLYVAANYETTICTKSGGLAALAELRHRGPEPLPLGLHAGPLRVSGAVAVGRRQGAHDGPRDSFRKRRDFRDAEIRVRVARRKKDARFDIFEAGRRRRRGVPGAYHSP